MNTPTPAELVGQLPPELSDVLHPSPTDQQLPATCITDRHWLAEQIRLHGQIWNIDDQHVLTTLWWYSASTVLVTPSLASLAVTGHAFSPRLQDLVLHHTPSSRFHGSHSTAMIDSDLLAAASSTLNTVIDAVATFTKGRPAPLWAIATQPTPLGRTRDQPRRPRHHPGRRDRRPDRPAIAARSLRGGWRAPIRGSHLVLPALPCSYPDQVHQLPATGQRRAPLPAQLRSTALSRRASHRRRLR